MTQLQTKRSIDEATIESIIIKGDLSGLSPIDKVKYYKHYCDNIGLDYSAQPFALLRLQGKETLYLTRSGAQQLNKLHNVSHKITARETANGCYVVTACASTPDGRATESIGAVNIENLKGEALCNAYMKAETKAKRRATLDLLGLGILDETETQTIVNAETVEIQTEKVDMMGAWRDAVNGCRNKKELGDLYRQNKEVIDANQDVFKLFSDRKTQFVNQEHN